MSRPNVYKVTGAESCAGREPYPGFYWRDFDDDMHGPYESRRDAIEAVDSYLFDRGLLDDGSQP